MNVPETEEFCPHCGYDMHSKPQEDNAAKNGEETIKNEENKTEQGSPTESKSIGEGSDNKAAGEKASFKKKKVLKIALIIIIAAVVATVVGILVTSHIHKSYIEKAYKGELQEESVGTLGFSLPKNVDVVENDANSLRAIFDKKKIGSLLLLYEENANGMELDKYIEEKYSDISDDYVTEEISGKGYEGIRYFSSDRSAKDFDDLSQKADSYSDTIEIIKSDKSIFVLQYLMDSDYYRKDNIDTINDHIDFASYETPVIQSIKADYSGKTKAETPISSDLIEGLKVVATYQNGEKKDIVSECDIDGPDVLIPGEKAVLKVSVTDWDKKKYTDKVTIKCTSTVKKLSVEYTGSKKNGTRIKKGSSDLEVTAKLDDGTKVKTDSYTIDGPKKLKGGEVNTYVIKYGGVTTELKIKAKKSFKQVAKPIIDEIERSKYANNEMFEYFFAYDEDDDGDHWITIKATLKRDVYSYLKLAEPGSDVALTYALIMADMKDYCEKIAKKFKKAGYGGTNVQFIVYNGYGGIFSAVTNEEIYTDPYSD